MAARSACPITRNVTAVVSPAFAVTIDARRDSQVTNTRPTRPIAIDLFAGAGGLSLGFEQAGFDICAAVEVDPVHAAVHKANFPNSAVICSDIRDVTGDAIRNAASLGNRDIAVVIGGPPCQGFSLIGHRVLTDSRNELVLHFLRIVKELHPLAFVMENVPGMATGRHTQLLDELLDEFQQAGYSVRLPYRILNAANFGVPQARRRLVILGARNGVALPAYPTPITTAPIRAGKSQLSLMSAPLPACPTVADAIGDLPDVDAYDFLTSSDELPIELGSGSDYALKLRGVESDPNDYSYPRRHPDSLLTGCQRAAHTDLSRKRFAATPNGTTEPISRFFKLADTGVCNTLRAGTATDHGAFTSPRPIHPHYARCITVREAARLHSYPDWFRFHRTIWHGFRQIGNSVPPLLGRAIGAEVLRSLAERPRRPRRSLEISTNGLASFNMSEAAAYFGVSRHAVAPRTRPSTASARPA